MYKRLLLTSSITFIAMTLNSVQAHGMLTNKQDFSVPIRASAVITKPNNKMNTYPINGMAPETQLQKSTVFLMNIKLSSSQKKRLQTFAPNLNDTSIIGMQSHLPDHVQLGMNNVPVLDQGMHGTCAIFANTAAIDALLGKGRYISQLCSLEMGEYLEKRSYLPSGWDGSLSPYVLNRLQEFGIVNITNQMNQFCSGVMQYPTNDEYNTGIPISLDEYAKVSENINDIDWYPLLMPFERFDWNPNNANQANRLLDDVKSALATSNAKATIRITFGVLLPVTYCSAGACAKYHKTDDTWAITKAIENDQYPLFGGHEMIITGYNDKAIAIDNEGSKHTGLLTLRNSWGDKHGDNGDFYMTYDFFKQYVVEVQKIVKNTPYLV